jgi:hypothetical protein
VCCWYIPVIYVDVNAAGANNGTSWQNAYNYLQDALQDANISAGCAAEIWVAAGMYKPDCNSVFPNGSGNRNATFDLINNVAIYGGFPSGGGLWESRNPNTYKTILSGDINTPDVNTDNSYHVVTGSNTNKTAVLDGFTVTAGNANGLQPRCGGGMYNKSGSPTVTNCTFSGNQGSGMYNDQSNSKVTNCTFSGNEAYYSSGGGMVNYNSSPMLTNCTFSGNRANYNGGGMSNSYSSPMVANCIFSGNSADSGGGMYNSYSSPMVTNCIIWGNIAPNGPQICDYNNSNPTITYSDVQGGWSGTGWDPDTDSNMVLNLNFEENRLAPPPPETNALCQYSPQFYPDYVGSFRLEANLIDYNAANYGVWQPGRIGTCANFGDSYDKRPADRPNDCKLQIVYDADHDIFGLGEEVDKHTFAFWFNVPDLSKGTIIRHADKKTASDGNFSDYWWEVRLFDGKLQFYHGRQYFCMETKDTLAKMGIDPNTWHHAAVVINRTTETSSRIYIDGLEVPVLVTDFNPGTLNVNFPGPGHGPNPVWVGAGASEFDGLLDEVLLFYSELSPVQVWILYYRTPSGTGNINADPCFVKCGYWGDVNDPNKHVEPNNPNAHWFDGNYRLLSGSPCIDAGDNNSVLPDYADLDGDGNKTEPMPLDLDGFERFVDDPNTADTGNGIPPIVDMGAYEFRCRYAIIGDLNNDCKVDFYDLKIMAENWLESGPTADIVPPPSGDSRVNFKDFAALAENWLIDCWLTPSNPACVPK